MASWLGMPPLKHTHRRMYVWTKNNAANGPLDGICITEIRGPIYKISYNNLAIIPKLRSTYNGRLIYHTSYEECKAFLRYDLLAKSKDRLR